MTRTQLFRFIAIMAVALAVPVASQAGLIFSVGFGPPPIPVYDQPMCPGPGYIWTPGYWAYGDEGYFWVPGTWVLAPFSGALWTPGYWGWGGSAYIWHAGYWGTSVGFYGGINYGFGYTGFGYGGGYWRGGSFFYNRAVNHVDAVHVRNVYMRNVVVRNSSRVSYNGGRGGLNYRASAAEMRAYNGRRSAPIQAQIQHRDMAMRNRSNFASVNHGAPSIAATQRAADFRGSTVRATRPGGAYHGNTPAARPAQHYNAPAQHYNAPAQHNAPAQRYNAPARRSYNAPARSYNAPAQHYNAPAQHAPQQHMNMPRQAPHTEARPSGRPSEGGHGGGEHRR